MKNKMQRERRKRNAECSHVEGFRPVLTGVTVMSHGGGICTCIPKDRPTQTQAGLTLLRLSECFAP